MNKVDQLALALHDALIQSEAYVSYLASLKNIQCNPQLKKQEEALKLLGKKIVQARQDSTMDVTPLIASYQALDEQFSNHPVLVNYLQDREQYERLCLEIKETIEGQLD